MPFFFDFPKNYMFLDRNRFNFWALFLNSSSSTDLPCVRSVKPSNTTPFNKLPSEIILQIIENVSPEDAISLGMLNDHLWVHVLQIIRSSTHRNIGLLAGQEVALTGTYLESLPEAFEHDDMMQKASRWIAPLLGSYAEKWNQSRMINHAALRRFGVLDGVNTEETWTNALDNVCEKYDISSSSPSHLRKDLRTYSSVLSETDKLQQWIFRNLTTKEYIVIKPERSKEDKNTVTCMYEYGYLDCGDVGDIRIDHIFLVQSYWTNKRVDRPSTDEDSSIDYGFDNGEWAGHKFDIVRRDMFDVDDPEAGWSDVSEEVAEKMSSIIKKWRLMDAMLCEAFQQPLDD